MDEYRLVNPILRQVMKKIYELRTDFDSECCNVRMECINDQDFVDISFASRGCTHEILGGCTMCNYGYRKEKKNDFDEIFTQLQLKIKQLPRKIHELLLVPTGSLLDDKEVPGDELIQVLQLVSHLECDEFICETRTDSISIERIQLLKKYIHSPKITLEIGVETTDLWLLRNCINKNSSFEQVEKTVNIAQNEGIEICANIGLGFPFVNEKISIISAVNSIRNMLALNSYCVLFAYNIRPGTLLEWLWNKGLYKCTSLWAMVEVLSYFSDDELKRIQISWYRNYYDDKTRILQMPCLCNKCESEVLGLLDDYRNHPCRETLQPLIDYNCSCKQEWYEQYRQQTEIIDIKEVERIYKIMGREFQIPEELVNNELRNMKLCLERKG